MTDGLPRWTGPPDPPERPGPGVPAAAASVGVVPEDVVREDAVVAPPPTGSDTVWAFVAGMGGMVVGSVVVLVPLLLTLGVGYTAFGLLGAAVGAGLGLRVGLVRRRGWGWREPGFVRSRRSSWHLLWQVPTALVVGLLCTVAIGSALGLTPEAAGGAGSEPDIFDDALVASPWLVAIALLCVVLLLPAAEEVVFRRVLLGWLLTRTPAVVAVALASLVFAAVHVLPAAVLYLFFLAVSANLLHLWQPEPVGSAGAARRQQHRRLAGR